MLLAACGNTQDNYEPDDNEPIYNIATVSWQEAYAEILQNYNYERVSDCGNFAGRLRFFLYDMDLDGIPEMVILNSFDETATVFTHRNGNIITLEHGEDISLVPLLHGAARTRIGSAPKNMPGFVFMYRGPSAGCFGTSAFFRRVIVDEYRLVIADYGEWYIDLDTLHEIFNSSGCDVDADELDVAIQENTHLSINGIPVSEDELRRVFGIEDPPSFVLHDINDYNINEIIFGWMPLDEYESHTPTTEPSNTITKQINEAMPPFTFHIQISTEPTIHEHDPHPMHETAILITDPQGEIIQHIDGLFQSALVVNWNELRFSDLNSNGYMDMSLLKRSGLRGTGAHYVWMWDAEKGQFLLHEQLMEIVAHNLSFSGELGTEGLLTVLHFSRMNNWGYSDFSYENGKFTQIRYTAGQYVFDPATVAWYAHVEITDLITGEMTTEREEVDFFWGSEISISNSDIRTVEKVDIGLSEPLLFRFDRWEVDVFVYQLVITIANQFGDLLQQIDGLYQTTSPWTPIEGEARQPQFVDLNFDGYLDLDLGEYTRWVWCPNERLFVLWETQ